MDSFRLSMEELNYFAVASVITGAAFVSFDGGLNIVNSLLYVLASAVALGLRELGQRQIAQWMDSYVDLELSLEGSIITVMGAMFAVITSLPVILLFPVFNEYSSKKYEQWGKSIPAMWIKRQYWLALGGIGFLMIGWLVSYSFGVRQLMEVLSIFTAFQLLPFNYSAIPTGDLDGSYIIRWSGFHWLILFGTSLVMVAISI